MIYVVYGQGGKYSPLSLFSLGLMRFKDQLQALYPNFVRDDIHWQNPDETIAAIAAQPEGEKTIIIGHSLGGNHASWVQSAGQDIDLIIGYDPTKNAYLNEIKPSCKRAICYYQENGEMFGGAKYTGHNVELHKTDTTHLSIDDDEELHKISLQAIAEVMG